MESRRWPKDRCGLLSL